MIQADDAVELVTDGMTIEAVIDALVSEFRSRIAEEGLAYAGGLSSSSRLAQASSSRSSTCSKPASPP